MEPEIQTEQEAYLAIMYACMSVDERVTETETEEVIHTLGAEKIFEHTDLVAIYKKVHLINQAVRYDAFKLIELAAPKISAELKMAVYQTAAGLLQADGVVFGIEKDLLQHLRNALNMENYSPGE